MAVHDSWRRSENPRPYEYRRVTKVKDLPVSERPRERLLKLGPASLDEVELLAEIRIV